MIKDFTALITAITVLIGTLAAIYFKLRNKIEEVHQEVNSRYTELFGRLDDMTEQRDAALKKKEPPHVT